MTHDWRTMRAAGALIAVAALLAALPGLVIPMLIRAFLNRVLVLGYPGWELIVLVGLMLCAATIGILVWLQWQACRLAAVRLSASTSARLVWHALRVPTSAVDSFGAGDLTARISAMQLRALQSGVLVPLALVNMLVIVVYAIFLLLLSPILGGAALGVVVVSAVVSYLLLMSRTRLQDAATQSTVELSAATTDVISEIETVKASAAEQWEFQRWSHASTDAARATAALSLDSQRLGLMAPITELLGLGVVLAIGTLLVFQGLLDLGTFVAVQGVLAALLIPASQVVWFFVLTKAAASAQRSADEVLDIPIDIEVTSLGSGPMPEQGPVSLGVRDIHFGYGETPLFDGVTLDVAAGCWTAVVGGSGSGKSTLARLCVGELQPWTGEILLDDRPRLETPRAWRSSVVGYVPQYPVLVPGSILDNIRMFDADVSEGDVADALATACMLDAVDRRPGGLLEEVSPTGHGFSGGELQRLAIARALVRRPGLLILDEATSALDPIVEAELDMRLRERVVTCLIIAHRLSTVRDADEIVVLERGRIEQRGTFNELRTGGRFRELVNG